LRTRAALPIASLTSTTIPTVSAITRSSAPRKQTVAVQIDSILRLSDRSYQVRWTEITRDLNGVNLGAPTHWEAQLQSQLIPPNSNDTIVTNPLGLYVMQISWTQQAQ